MIYFLLVFWIGFSAIFWHKRHNQKKTIRYRTVFGKSEVNYFLISTIMFVIISFRASEIGVDTFTYHRIFNNIFLSESYNYFGSFSRIEPLFYYLNKLLGVVTNGWAQSIIIAEGLFVVFCYLRTIKKYSLNPFISLLAFLAFGIFLASLDLLRQMMAISICAYSLEYVFEKKPLKFYLLVIVAAMFHYTAIFFSVVYFVSAVMKKNRRNTILLILIMLIGYVTVDVLQSFTSTVFDRWSIYGSIETGAQGYVSFVIFLIITILVAIEKNWIIKNCKHGPALIYLNYMHMGFWLMRLVTRNAERISFYYAIAPILLLPLLFKAREVHSSKILADMFKIVAIVFMIVFFIYKVTRDPSNFPYRFFIF